MTSPNEAPREAWKGWSDADPEMLEPFYSKWVGLLTSEGLHSKADIATVLALLDQRIHKLQSPLPATQRSEPCQRLGCRFEVAQSMLDRAKERGELSEEERASLRAESAPSGTAKVVEGVGDDKGQSKLRAAVRDAFEHGVCVKARYTTRGDNWRVKHADAIQAALDSAVPVQCGNKEPK